MPYGVYRSSRFGPGMNIAWRSPRPGSALDRFALVKVANRGKKRRPLSVIRTPGVEQSMGNFVWSGSVPFGKSDGMVLQGSPDAFYDEIEQQELAKSGEISETERRIALATNVGGVAAAPGLLYMAARAAKNNEGSWPRATTKAIAGSKRLKGTKAGQKVLRAAAKLDKPVSGKQKAAAYVAGAGLVGLQSANALGDAIAARAMANAEKT